jgi:hypothetical protein
MAIDVELKATLPFFRSRGDSGRPPTPIASGTGIALALEPPPAEGRFVTRRIVDLTDGP